eukprot:CAMPEP_0195515132 /NCGR_PEP_ID=MMETSP0794_2-20130614/6314_1 /TAXON_ID=515487 /ORGANISM="Stephanopyxis turris, Strain CCMP 815" /LENGTH=180 /DNA_ID=CAMNT_0040643515 /DNA_START=174 /DNA_END=717 /DNA_ORIENTATION=-
MTKDQKAIHDDIVKSRPRTGISGPFGPWLAVPVIAQPSQELGRACRYGTSLTKKRIRNGHFTHWRKDEVTYGIDLHTGEALLAGLSMNFIKAIPRDKEFSLERVKNDLLPLLEEERDLAIASFTAELLDTFTVSESTYAATKAAVNGKESVLVEITSIVGYYTYVAFTLNVFNIPSVLPK